MKKYYMSFVDFSEISNVTADEEQLKKSRDHGGIRAAYGKRKS